MCCVVWLASANVHFCNYKFPDFLDPKSLNVCLSVCEHFLWFMDFNNNGKQTKHASF